MTCWTLSLPLCCRHASFPSSSTAGGYQAFVGVRRDEARWRSSASSLVASHSVSAQFPDSVSCAAFSSRSQTAPDDAATSSSCSGFSVVEEFYNCINRRDFVSVEELIAEGCIYEDLVFPKPFLGRKAIIDFFRKFTAAVGSDLQFVIDDISKEDPISVGVTWHLEWNGKPFPFSKGCSFYRLTRNGPCQQICYARDCVEPAVKPGESVLLIIKAVAALLRKFPSLADRF